MRAVRSWRIRWGVVARVPRAAIRRIVPAVATQRKKGEYKIRPYGVAFAVLLVWAAPAGAASRDLAGRLAQLVAEGERDGRTWAVRVDRLDTGETLFAHRADVLRLPASNVKLFATAAALHRLGPDFTVATSVYATGPITGGVLAGDLVLYGRGDANISGRFHEDRVTAVLEALAAQVRAAGVRRVAGGVVGDGTYFEDLDFGPWKLEDQHRWYAARVRALSFNDNCVDMYLGPGRTVGARAALRWEPFTRYVRVKVTAKTVAGRSKKLYAWRAPGSRVIALGGTIGRRARIEPLPVAIEDPPLFAAWVFRDVLERAGVTVAGAPRSVARAAGRSRPAYDREIARHVSPPLAEGIRVINSRSQNLHAELLVKTLGREVGADGTWAEGLRAVHAAVCELGVQGEAVRLVDGSGLGRENRATAGALVTRLRAMAGHEHAAAFVASLVQVGADRGLADLAKSVRHGEVRAKSGSLNGVLALAGYVRAPGRAPLAFAMLGDDPNPKSSRHLRATRDKMVYQLVRLSP